MTDGAETCHSSIEGAKEREAMLSIQCTQQYLQNAVCVCLKESQGCYNRQFKVNKTNNVQTSQGE